MIKRCDKRGQFYLLSAIIIISIIIGFSAVSTYTRQGSQVRVFDLGDELDIESAAVLDHGTYNINEIGDLDNFLLGFANNYSEYVGEGTEISFVFGNPADTEATVVNYEDVVQGDIDYAGQIVHTTKKRIKNETTADIEPAEGDTDTKITTVIFNDQSYNFTLTPGENFYFVISQEVGEEVHTTKSRRSRR